MQTVKPIFSYLPCLQAPLASTILYHFHWPWPKQSHFASFSGNFSSDQDEIWCGDDAIQAEDLETNFEYDLLKLGK